MTTVYFIRHAEPNYTNHNDELRELSEKGIEDRKLVIGSHGTALSTIINYYDDTFGYAEFEKIRELMPWIVCFTFEGMNCVSIQSYNLFTK